MPYARSGPASIYFEDHGTGFPLLALAPGGMDSKIEYWPRAAIDLLGAFPDRFRIVVTDQRNAGRSTGPLDPNDAARVRSGTG